MVERCSNGVAFVVLEPEPTLRTGIRVDIYDGGDPATLLDTLPDTWARQWTDAVKGPGSGRFSVYATNPKLVANPDLLAYGNIARFILDGVTRFGITIEKRRLSQLGSGDDAAHVLTVEGRGVLAKLEDALVYRAGGVNAGDVERPFDTNAGAAMETLVLEAQTRGALHGITLGFTDSTDSNNAPYDLPIELTERAGTDLLRVAERHAEVAVDVQMTPGLELRYFNTRGVDRTIQTTNVGPVELRAGKNLVALERDETGAIRNTLYIEAPGGYFERLEAASVTEHRRREAFLSLGNVTASDQIDRSALAVFRRSAQPAADIGAEVLDVEGARPYVDWAPGDWVLAPDEAGALTRYRVRALTVAETPEGRPTYVPELATITEELDARLERWMKAMARGTMGGTAGDVAEPNKAPQEVVDAITDEVADHVAEVPHVDELSDLVDVDLTDLEHDDGLRYSAGAGQWLPVGRALDDLTDVNAGTPVDGQVLTWNQTAGEWRALTPSGGGGGGGGLTVGTGSEATLVGADEDAGASPLAIPVPAGIAAGDLCIAAIMTANSIPDANGPEGGGWTKLIHFDTSTNEYNAIWTKIAGGSEPATWSWSHSAGSDVQAAAAVYRSPLGDLDTIIDTGWTPDTLQAPWILGHPEGLHVLVFMTTTGSDDLGIGAGVALTTDIYIVNAATGNRPRILIAHRDTRTEFDGFPKVATGNPTQYSLGFAATFAADAP